MAGQIFSAILILVYLSGAGNLNVAVWLPDLDELYEFITRDLAGDDTRRKILNQSA
jgi:hypothetical protein